MQRPLALIGFGEAGSTFAFAGDWRDRACAFDIDPTRAAVMQECGITVAPSPAACMVGAALALSLVTADQTLDAARSCAPHLAPGTYWCDMNSVAPDTKRQAAGIMEAVGGRYVDVAVLAPVNPARLSVPLLLAGTWADKAASLLGAAGFTRTRVVGSEIGNASAIKMIRSVMVKGIEALTVEMMLAAAAAGVIGEVLASLDASEKPQPWARRAEYNIERMVTHGTRRAAEMAEAARTLDGLGVEPLMTSAIVVRQREMAGQTELLMPNLSDFAQKEPR